MNSNPIAQTRDMLSEIQSAKVFYMTQSDYRDPLIGIINSICFEYSQRMFHELKMIGDDIQSIFKMLNSQNECMGTNPLFQRLLEYTDRLERIRLRFLQLIGQIDECIFTLQKTIKIEQSASRKRIYCRNELKQIDLAQLKDNLNGLGNALHDTRSIISVLMMRTYIFDRIFQRMRLEVDVEGLDDIHIPLNRIRGNVQLIINHDENIQVALKTFDTHLIQPISAYA